MLVRDLLDATNLLGGLDLSNQIVEMQYLLPRLIGFLPVFQCNNSRSMLHVLQ
jgi:hypothetical protein